MNNMLYQDIKANGKIHLIFAHTKIAKVHKSSS